MVKGTAKGPGQRSHLDTASGATETLGQTTLWPHEHSWDLSQVARSQTLQAHSAAPHSHLGYLVLSGGNWAPRTPQAVVLSPPHPATAILSRHHHDLRSSGSSAHIVQPSTGDLLTMNRLKTQGQFSRSLPPMAPPYSDCPLSESILPRLDLVFPSWLIPRESC